MKKTLVALAALAAATGAFAQSPNARAIDASGVTIFGVADASITNYKADGAGSVNRLQGEGRNESTRLGFRGIEDIGGGWGAGFWLEAAYAQDSGAGTTTSANNTSIGQTGLLNSTSNTGMSASVVSLGGLQGLTFNRAATVSLLNKNGGEIRVGRDYSPAFWNLTAFDPFGTVGAGAYTNIALGALNPRNQVVAPGNPSPQVRTSNSVGWLSNNMNGFRAQLQYAFSEQLSTCTDLGGTGTGVSTNNCAGPASAGATTGLRLSYASGPLSAGFGWAKTTYQNSTTAALLNNAGSTVTALAYTGDYTQMNLAGAYDFGVAKVMVQYGQNTYGAQNYAANDATAAKPLAGAAGAAANVGTVSTPQATVVHSMIGATIPQGAMTWKVSYGTATKNSAAASVTSTTGTVTTPNVLDGAKQTQFALGGVYDLSKRTAVYGTWSKMSVTGNGAQASQGVSSVAASASEDRSAQTMDLGVRHRF